MNPSFVKRGCFVSGCGCFFLLGAVASFIFLMGFGFQNFTDQETRFLHPGDRTETFEDPGSFVIYYEPHVVFDTRTYDGPATLPPVEITVTMDERVVQVIPDTSLTFENDEDGGRKGQSIATFTIDEPGTYSIKTDYAPEVTDGPQVGFTLRESVGGRAGKAAGISVIVAGILGVLGVIFVLLGIVVMVKGPLGQRKR